MFRGYDERRPRHREYKKGICFEEARRRRDQVTVQLRKQKRAEKLRKLRRTNAAKAQAVPKHAHDAWTTAPAYEKAGDARERFAKYTTMMRKLHEKDQASMLEGVTWFRKILSIENDPPIDEVVRSGAVLRLVQLLRFSGSPRIQFESAWALTNIASGTSSQTQHVVKCGAIDAFVKLLGAHEMNIREQAVWALGNIAGDSSKLRNLVLSHGALPGMLRLCKNETKRSLVRNASWAVSNCCRGKPQPPFATVRHALPVLAHLAKRQDIDILTDACWAFSYLSDDCDPKNGKIQDVIRSGIVPRLVKLLGHTQDSIRTPALRTLGNIVTGDDVQTQVVINAGALPALRSLLRDSKTMIVKETCWTLSNITAGTRPQIQAVFDASIIEPLVHLLGHGKFDVKKEATWAISNATCGGSENQIIQLVRLGVLPPLIGLLSCDESKIVLVALEGIENILRVGDKLNDKERDENPFAIRVENEGGIEKLEVLEYHRNTNVNRKASHILKMFFEEIDGASEDTTLAPGIDESAGQFEFGLANRMEPAGASGAAASTVAWDGDTSWLDAVDPKDFHDFAGD